MSTTTTARRNQQLKLVRTCETWKPSSAKRGTATTLGSSASAAGGHLRPSLTDVADQPRGSRFFGCRARLVAPALSNGGWSPPSSASSRRADAEKNKGSECTVWPAQPPARALSSSHQPTKLGSSGDMKSAKAARLSSDVVGSSTTPIKRVHGSSSTTTIGGFETIALPLSSQAQWHGRA
jgi:hypothetical protein